MLGNVAEQLQGSREYSRRLKTHPRGEPVLRIMGEDVTEEVRSSVCLMFIIKSSTQLMPMSIFNLQACRGKLFDEGVTVTPADAVFGDASAIRILPAGADFIICSSVAEGESSGIRLNLQLRGEVKKIAGQIFLTI